MQTVDLRLCEIAIDQADTSSFEKFVQAFHAALVGSDFVPLGGMHDGGADGFEEQIHENQQRPNSFLQASKTGDLTGKINKTVRRLKEFGRNPNVVLFYFSQPEANVDEQEEVLSNKHNITIRIRGKRYIVANINSNPQTVAAYNSYLKQFTLFLNNIGASAQQRTYPFEAKALCAFLGQEANRRRGNATLLTSVTDSLILWSLEGTDPDKNLFMSREEISKKILSAIPTAKQFVKGTLDACLERLSSKGNSSGREISWHKKIDKFCLRLDQRQKVVEDSIDDAAIFSEASDAFRVFIRDALPPKLHNNVENITIAAHHCIEGMFERQGLAVSMFLQDGNSTGLEDLSVSDLIEARTFELGLEAADIRLVRDCIANLLRMAIYKPCAVLREYMLRLSTTYFLMFTLKNDPKVVEYFNNLSQHLVLYVGSDLLIRALSEYHVAPEGRLVTNALSLIRDAGATLILAEPCFDEIFTHIRASDFEFENYYAPVEGEIDENFVSCIDRILIRAYFYARLGTNTIGARPKGWRSYISQFCSHEGLRGGQAKASLRYYLCDKFGLSYEMFSDMKKAVDRDDLRSLTSTIYAEREWKGKRRGNILAHNDALHALRVFAKRSELKEDIVPNPFGYRTWWLTHEVAVQRAVAIHYEGKKPRFVMRPEFILNYLVLSPTKKAVADSYKAVFPTILGVSLSKRVQPQLLHEVLESAREAYAVDDSRARAKIIEFTNNLKSDQLRRFEIPFAEPN